ncbi:MAG: ATPase [Halobacteriovorax sp.]|nr:ATPase [Halobacteriovorax sp.]|tara:strand:- start:128852 stop:129895 length:1044 start_codon:yes stop_codon:yes gene_type:complete
MSCCPQEVKVETSCHGTSTKKRDWLLIGSSLIIGLSYFQHFFLPGIQLHFSHSIVELMNTMAPGILLGLVFVGLLSFIPREVVISAVGSPTSIKGIFKATAAGLLLDLCSHGILMVGMKLYERGASLAQVMAFLIASPWNSISLTFILFTLVGAKLTISFIVLSGIIAIITGLIVRVLLLKKLIPNNINQTELPSDYQVWPNLKASFKGKFFTVLFYKELAVNGFRDGQMVLRWIFFGAVLTSAVRLVASPEILQEYVGPTMGGMGITLFVATVLEVCSEGSTPLAADLVTRAKAPGNAFAFLMTGVSTDYTEIMSLKDTTKSWLCTLILPALTIPQIVLISYLLNQ